MHWELWDIESGNLVDSFTSEHLALALVEGMLRRHGAPYVEAFALATENRRGDTRLIARGPDLVRLVSRQAAVRPKATRPRSRAS